MAKRAKLHVSWLIACAGLAVIAGIVLSVIPAMRLATGWLAAAAAIAAISASRRSFGSLLLIAAAGLIFGTWRGGLEQTGLHQYQQFYGLVVTVQAAVSDDTTYGPGGDQRLMLSDVTVNNAPMNGQIWVSSDAAHTLKRSDHVTIQGKLGVGFGSVAASMFHASIIRITQPGSPDVGVQVRDWFSRGIHAAIPEPESDLASGYLVGQRTNLPPELDGELKSTGLTHAVVASGYNLTILVSLARQLLAGISKYLATFSAVILISGFMLISGLSPSMARAGLVASLSLAAWYYGRRIHPLVLLPVAAAATAVINPFYVWGDIGWYLSFASFAGVIILAPLVQHALWPGVKQPGALARLIIDTMSAQIATLPIMALAFGHYSTYALIANLLVLPLIPLTMLLTFVAGTVSIVIPAAAHLVGLPATLVLRYMITVVAHIADWPGAYGEVTLGLPILAACYLLMTAAAILLWHRTKHDFRAEYVRVDDT